MITATSTTFKSIPKVWLRAGVIMAVMVIVPLFNFQFITGPLVNACLLLIVMLAGLNQARFAALIPSIIALSVGLLPVALAPTIPYIMLANIIFVTVFDKMRVKNYWYGVIAASLAKFAFLAASSYIVGQLMFGQAIAAKATAMLSWPQLLTALGGGIIAYAILKALKRI
ncbi:MAG: hypothetical protein WCW27_02985 [Patescibacteria group bacterium]|jgi:hypothetical protein